MVIVVAYDVNTEDRTGRRRLRRVARACKDYGVRVQKSVFECRVGDADWARLKNRLLKEMDAKQDSIRLYFIDEASHRKTEHFGCAKPADLDGPLVV